MQDYIKCNNYFFRLYSFFFSSSLTAVLALLCFKMRFPRPVSCVLVASSILSQTLATPFVTDPTQNISYQGIISSPGIETFLNIPYGKDTSGSLRFAPPEPFLPPSGSIVNATTEGPSCPQKAGGGFLYSTNVTYMSEDCLNLLVARPSNVTEGKRVPVMVYIYGGECDLAFHEVEGRMD